MSLKGEKVESMKPIIKEKLNLFGIDVFEFYAESEGIKSELAESDKNWLKISKTNTREI